MEKKNTVLYSIPCMALFRPARKRHCDEEINLRERSIRFARHFPWRRLDERIASFRGKANPLSFRGFSLCGSDSRVAY
jgi:hypothetical protein